MSMTWELIKNADPHPSTPHQPTECETETQWAKPYVTLTPLTSENSGDLPLPFLAQLIGHLNPEETAYWLARGGRWTNQLPSLTGVLPSCRWIG